MASSCVPVQVPMLIKSNYDNWSLRMMAILGAHDTMGISKVQAIAPFKDCFDAHTAGKNTRTGFNVPLIEIGVPDVIEESKWSFYGANTVVKVTETVMCLAFLNGGKNPKDLMVVGTHQLQDYMLEFDFSSSTFTFDQLADVLTKQVFRPLLTCLPDKIRFLDGPPSSSLGV